jgi:hypothetical protein
MRHAGLAPRRHGRRASFYRRNPSEEDGANERGFLIILFGTIAIMMIVLSIFVFGSERSADNVDKALDFCSVAMTNLAAVVAGGGLYYRFRRSERYYFSASLIMLGVAFVLYTLAHLRQTVMAPLAADILVLVVFSALLWTPFVRLAQKGKNLASIVTILFGTLGFIAVGYIFYFFNNPCALYPYCLLVAAEHPENERSHWADDRKAKHHGPP